MNQANLFTDKKCHICGELLPFRDDSHFVLKGFTDQDTGQTCCMNMACKRKHYELKSQTKHANQYSEIPVTLNVRKYE